jgi:broad specificity phosphatase PhoE
MTTILLIRHAAIDALGLKLVGRAPGVHLNPKGKAEAERLAFRLEALRIARIYSSPLERARETAAVIAERVGTEIQIDEDLDEIDFGQWTNMDFRELEKIPEWQKFNTARCTAQIPGGENIFQVWQRANRAVQRITQTHVDACVALVSHADWIRTAVAGSLGLPLDALQKFTVDPASISALHIDQESIRVLRWNDRANSPFELETGNDCVLDRHVTANVSGR